ncbi:FAD-dependent oxidoreductase [Myxococcus sp. K15C18031901]|uniref:FAD-dependent oxidoreductase n=1 Tax=Myxococcus dinghuensis TaxID=2906761 RepID=UPI0020A7A5E6|nr:FAD-dependent oxidoreductase [Myxococcus dinghuensis]MCP3098147.1 FAD-dependent oxidoreductase [Myxococcus dinghuensis]
MDDTRNHRSLWTVTAPPRDFPVARGDLTVDVAVIGGGIAGLTTAFLLKRAGKRVAVLEMHRVLSGQTGQTTAHLTELLDTPYSTLRRDFGEKGARLAATSSRVALEQVATLVETLGLDCDFQRVPAFRFAETTRELEALEQELTEARDAGLLASLVRSVPLPFPVKGAMRVEDQALVHPRKYLLGLADRIPGDGSHVLEQTRVTEIHEGTPCRVVTDHGVVTATDVVEATTVPLNRVALQTRLYPYRTYAVAGPLESPLEAAQYDDSQEPYHYLRTQRVDGRVYLIVGGEDHKVGAEQDTDRRYAALEDYTLKRFPVRSLTHRWSGQVIEPVDGLPFIGRNVGSRHVHVATGFSGTGMTFGTLAGMLLTDLILGNESPFTALYSPSRKKPLAGVRDFLQENADVAFRFVADRLSRPEAQHLSEVAPGEAKVLEVEGQKVAVYREPDGTAHAVSPVCTHLGCHVHWNGAERSWDCPCHGARYSPTGKVLNGPAMKDLPSRQLPKLPE